MAEVYSKAKSQQQFYTLLEQQGIKCYVHGKHIGIKASRKYRLKTLGYSLERIALLELEKTKRQKELTRLIKTKQKEHDLDQELER